MSTITVGGAIPVGEYTEALGNELAELGAVMLQRGGRPALKMDPRARALMQNINQRFLALETAAKTNASLKPMLKLTAGARSVTQAAMAAAASHRVKATRDYLEQPTHVIPVGFDAIPLGSLSGIATIKAPHNQPWRLLNIHTNDNQCTGMRFVSIKLANTEHVLASNIAWSAGAPVNPGIDAAVFSGKMHRGLQPTFQYRPWALGRGGWLRSDAEILLQVFNPSATTAASLNVSLLVQSSPCGEGVGYATTAVLPNGSPEANRMWRKLGKGFLNLWPRALKR
jgi:hypothetical protein